MTESTTIVIEGPLWFIGALVICTWHACLLWSWCRERRAYLAWWKKYDADARVRHDRFMRHMQPDSLAMDSWSLDGNREKEQA
jgi:hypothetical protein